VPSPHPAPVPDGNLMRCGVCGWPLDDERFCTPTSCSQRPPPQATYRERLEQSARMQEQARWREERRQRVRECLLELTKCRDLSVQRIAQEGLDAWHDVEPPAGEEGARAR